MRTQRKGARVALVVATMLALVGLTATGAAAQSDDTTPTTAPTVTAPQASATVTGQPTVSGTLDDESIRVLIDNCEVGTAEVFIDGIPVATVTLTDDATAADFEAAASSTVVVAIPEGASPPYQVTVVCENGTADTIVTVPVAQTPDEGADAPQEEGGAAGGGTGSGGGSLPLTGGGDTLVPLARGAAVAVAVGALMVLASRRRTAVA
ncbi:MAG: hypothetical protein AAGA17_13540 [Actinomycetota bacterium]